MWRLCLWLTNFLVTESQVPEDLFLISMQINGRSSPILPKWCVLVYYSFQPCITCENPFSIYSQKFSKIVTKFWIRIKRTDRSHVCPANTNEWTLQQPVLLLITSRVCGRGNVFVVCVCLSVCLSVCVSVQAITFEAIDIETSFLVWWYILTISRSSLSIKVIGSKSRSYHGKC